MLEFITTRINAAQVLKAVIGVVSVSYVCGAIADEIDSSSGWHLIKSCDVSFYGASTNMMYWAKGSASGTKGASTVGLTEGEDYFVSEILGRDPGKS